METEPKLSKNAITVLERRYLKRDQSGMVLETPGEMFRRVAVAVAGAEQVFDETATITPNGKGSVVAYDFWQMMADLEFLPNSPTLMNAGRELGQLSACFVLPIGDSMEEIFDAIKYTALIHKSGGGTGFSFSRLRPANDAVKSTTGISSGPISFMKVFDAATETIKQGGTRRGANMGILRVDHPDILDFIVCKDNQVGLNNFNISVGITDDFMNALFAGVEYALWNPRTNESCGTLNARAVWNLIVIQAWKNGEPGIVFLDRMNRDNPTPSVGEIESTNPCGEQPLLPYEACNLGSINLAKMLTYYDGKCGVDWLHLGRTVRLAVRFLDNVIEVNKYPLPQIDEMTRANRKIGLGVMGWADMLIQMGIPYNSDEALKLADAVMSFITHAGYEESKKLGIQRGAFPNFSETSIKDSVRNATVTTIAPTGTISIIADCSSGIEPIFAVSYVRNVMDGDKLVEVNPYFEAIAKGRGFYSEELMERIAEHGTVQGIDEVPRDVQRIFVTAHDIAPEDHVRMQAAFQHHTHNAVSKTVNFSNSATVDDVREVYEKAYELGCKGVTIYRDGSRDSQVLSTGGTGEKKEEAKPVEQVPAIKRERPQALKGWTYQMQTGCGNIYVTINEDETGLCEVFATMGKAGGCAASQSQAIGRIASLAWRSGVPVSAVVKQLQGISCHAPAGFGENKVLSCADAVAKAIARHMEAMGDAVVIEKKAPLVGACPECGGIVEHEGGCSVCRACGYSACA